MFGNEIDFHGGGIDLKFPHHHNEVLQSNSYYGINNVFKHFSYTGHICVKGEKMAQSIGNYLSLEDYLKVHSANSMRLLFWLSLWSNPVDLTDELIEQAKTLETRINELLSSIEYNLKLNKNFPLLNNFDKISKIYELFDEIDEVLSDEFKTHEAISKFNDVITQTNIVMRDNFVDNLTLEQIKTQILNLLHIIGFKMETSTTNTQLFEQSVIDELLQLRTKLKLAKQYELSDYVRDVLFQNLGFQVQDMKDGVKIKKLTKL
jgi:cysteinyl-tRNA synthetase